MKISVIVTSFNSEKFLKFSINSVLSQTHQDFELIIVDDCSKDKTREIINKFQKKDKRIKAILLKKNTGTAAIPRNIGAKLAKSKYLCFLDADDIWLSDKLEKQIQNINKDTILSFTACTYIKKDGKKYSNNFQDYFRQFLQKKLYKTICKGLYAYNFIILSSALVKKDVFLKFLFDSSKSIVGVEDLDLWLRLLYKKKEKNLSFINEKLVKIRRTPNSLNINYTFASLRNTYCIMRFFLERKIYKQLHFFLMGITLRTIKTLIKISEKSFKKNMLKISFSLIFFYLLIFNSPLFMYLGNNLIHYDKPEITKNLIILAGNGNADYLNNEYQKRYLDTKILLKDNNFDRIFIMGRSQEVEEAEIIRSLLVYDEISDEKIFLINNTFGNTKENIAELTKVLTRYGIKESNFLTSPYHTKRSRLLWNKHKSKVKIYVTKNKDDPSLQKNWNYNVKEIKVIIYENISIIYNKLRGWI